MSSAITCSSRMREPVRRPAGVRSDVQQPLAGLEGDRVPQLLDRGGLHVPVAVVDRRAAAGSCPVPAVGAHVLGEAPEAGGLAGRRARAAGASAGRPRGAPGTRAPQRAAAQDALADLAGVGFVGGAARASARAGRRGSAGTPGRNLRACDRSISGRRRGAARERHRSRARSAGASATSAGTLQRVDSPGPTCSRRLCRFPRRPTRSRSDGSSRSRREGVGDRGAVGRGHQAVLAVGAEVAVAVGVGADDGAAGGHRLQRRQAEALVHRGLHEHRGLG